MSETPPSDKWDGYKIGGFLSSSCLPRRVPLVSRAWNWTSACAEVRLFSGRISKDLGGCFP